MLTLISTVVSFSPCEEMEPAEVARRALRQESSVSFLAQLLRENLGEVLQGMPVFPVLKGCLPLGNQ